MSSKHGRNVHAAAVRRHFARLQATAPMRLAYSEPIGPVVGRLTFWQRVRVAFGFCA